MSGFPAPQPTAADYSAQAADALPLRALKLAEVPASEANREEIRRLAARSRLLNFILENHRQRQVDAVRGLRSSGAE